MIITATVLLATGVVKLYDLVVAMTLGGPGIATEVPAKFVMDHLFERNNIALGTAAATLMLITVVIILAPWVYSTYVRPQGGGHDRRRAPGPPPRRLTAGRIGVYAFLATAALFFLLPLWIMVLTSLKPMEEIRLGNILALRRHRRSMPGSRPGRRPARVSSATASASVLELRAHPDPVRDPFDRGRRRERLRVVHVAGQGREPHVRHPAARRLHPLPGVSLPLVRIFSQAGIYNSLLCIVLVHVIFGLPTMTLMFRNYYAGIPIELFKAARIDGGGFWSIFFRVMLPMSTPMLVVATILQVTGIWNDFIFGLTFAGRENLPMTVQLNNIVHSTQGERAYNVDMAATMLAALVPLVVYFVSGRWFVRGIAAGAVKG